MIEVVLNDRLGKKIRVKCKCGCGPGRAQSPHARARGHSTPTGLSQDSEARGVKQRLH